MQKILILSLLLFLGWGCEPSWDFTSLEEPPKLVVYGYIQPSDVVKLRVSRTVAPLDNQTPRAITDAAVILFEDGTAVDTLQHSSDGIYSSVKSFRPAVGKSYYVEIFKEGFPLLRSIEEVLPETLKVKNYETKDFAGFVPDACIGCSTPPIVKAQILIQFEPHNVDNVGYRGTHLNPDKPTNFRYLNIREDCFRFGMLDMNYMGIECLANPNELLLENWDYPRGEISTVSVELCVVTEQAALYHAKLNNNNSITAGQSVDVFYEPTFLPKMVEGGYGYFGACNCTQFEATF